MSKHRGRRERVARKKRSKRRGWMAKMDRFGMVTLKLGRKKSMECCRLKKDDTTELKKRFRGCVVEAEG